MLKIVSVKIWGSQLIKNIFIKFLGNIGDHKEYKNVKMNLVGDMWVP